MDYIICGKKKLTGELAVYGAKNCALALLGASVLTKDAVTLKNCPEMADVENMLILLSEMGKKVARLGDEVTIWGEVSQNVPKEHAAMLRGSGLVLGGLAAKYGAAFLPSTGGCAIGSRPIDIHLEGLRALGVSVKQTPLGVECVGKPLGGEFTLRFPSVGATENLLCAAALASGDTILKNCALEPEVVALERTLSGMGAKLEGIGTSDLKISGQKSLHGGEFTVIPDRIVAGTYLACAAAAGGELFVRCCPNHSEAFLEILKLRHEVKIYSNGIRLKANHPSDYGCVATAPYPAFPTDLQSILLSLCAESNDGISRITENLFENRLSHNAGELNKMGGDVRVFGQTAEIIGKKLRGTIVSANDLRGGAGLVVAALGAEGQTTVQHAEHILRGYCDLAENLRSVGADIVAK